MDKAEVYKTAYKAAHEHCLIEFGRPANKAYELAVYYAFIRACSTVGVASSYEQSTAIADKHASTGSSIIAEAIATHAARVAIQEVDRLATEAK